MRFIFPCGHSKRVKVTLTKAWEIWELDETGHVIQMDDSGHDERTEKWACATCNTPVDIEG